ncbi:hypothetical protein TNCT_196981 [Trichonephila clavata]|uniref:Uncharacterized protein n=1 Tax=Trichonephila clavata TaxID=2740835 RepID=A0A8X6GBZ4_TRICU|nr:hypothetical protein TNCT_196981 [Trichonephila clavata]
MLDIVRDSDFQKRPVMTDCTVAGWEMVVGSLPLPLLQLLLRSKAQGQWGGGVGLERGFRTMMLSGGTEAIGVRFPPFLVFRHWGGREGRGTAAVAAVPFSPLGSSTGVGWFFRTLRRSGQGFSPLPGS